MKIYFQTFMGQKVLLTIKKQTTTLDLIKSIAVKLGIPEENVRLTIDQQLKNETHLVKLGNAAEIDKKIFEQFKENLWQFTIRTLESQPRIIFDATNLQKRFAVLDQPQN